MKPKNKPLQVRVLLCAKLLRVTETMKFVVIPLSNVIALQLRTSVVNGITYNCNRSDLFKHIFRYANFVQVLWILSKHRIRTTFFNVIVNSLLTVSRFILQLSTHTKVSWHRARLNLPATVNLIINYDTNNFDNASNYSQCRWCYYAWGCLSGSGKVQTYD